MAANLGSVETLLAARPGSWEADLVRRLVNGTAGEDGELVRWRTQPVRVPFDAYRPKALTLREPARLNHYTAWRWVTPTGDRCAIRKAKLSPDPALEPPWEYRFEALPARVRL